MNRNCVQFVLLSLVFVLTGMAGAAEFAGGTGEPNDPYLIATAEQLLGANFTEPGTHYQLCANIDLDRKAITPCYFRAHLDGAGFEIRSAVVVMSNRSVFGIIEPEGIIENLTLADLDLGLTPWPGWPSIPEEVGGLAAENHGGVVNCHVTGWIATQEVLNVGGVVGYNAGSMTNCSFEGWVSTDWEESEDDIDAKYAWVGGLVSRNDGSIADSFARGIVIGRTGVGGFAGVNNGTISNCYAFGLVLGETGAGGLVSCNGGSLRKCYAVSRVTGQMRGGLVGMAGVCDGDAFDCLWDTWTTSCPTSGTGIGSPVLDALAPDIWARCGWSGDPNWVIVNDYGIVENYPRLAWEGTDGEVIPEPPAYWAYWGPSGGSGTESDPHVIRTEDALLYLCTASILWDKHFVLGADVDMHFPSDFSPIGVCRGTSFSGTFDGNGHVIRNVVFDVHDEFSDDEATAWNLGLFGYVTGEVRNLHVQNVRFEAGMNSQRVGLLTGTCAGVIENCSASGSISVGENSQFIGELVGFNGGEVSDCEATATIEAGEGSTYVGGLIGFETRR